ncbi:MAG: tRNA (N6-threonylcarbamoyladenosine(37)-N6)-methyltransferase TrmO [Candidatus Thorarchaeota archaeon]
MSFTVVPIGHVSKVEETIKIVIDDEFSAGLTHVELFSHVIILWWIDRRDNPGDRTTLLTNPPRNKGLTPSGVFACRSPSRPNPIGHTIAAVLRVDHDAGEVYLDHMDADDGTPVLDIKPYMPSSDCVSDARVAPWFETLQRRY